VAETPDAVRSPTGASLRNENDDDLGDNRA
jgi:hypothetical protein